MKTNQLVMTETEDQGCFLFRWNQELLCYERVATGAYGKQGERFCLLGQSENDFAIWFLDSWGSLCKSPDHCSAAECHVKDDKGVFYLYNGDWYFRNYEEDSEVVLGTELISRNSYYRKGADGCVMVTSVCDGKCEVRSYTGLRVQRGFRLYPYVDDEYGIFLEREDGSYDIINNRNKWVSTTCFKERVSASSYRLFCLREDRHFDDCGVVEYAKDWGNAYLKLDPKTGKFQLFSIRVGGPVLVHEASGRHLKIVENEYGYMEALRINGYRYCVSYRVSPDGEDELFFNWKMVRKAWWRSLLDISNS